MVTQRSGQKDQGSGEGYKPEKDKVLMGKAIKSTREGERFRWELRIYEGSKPRVVAWREFWGRENTWVREIKSEQTLALQFLRSVTRNITELGAHCQKWESEQAAKSAPAPVDQSKHLETLSPEEKAAIEKMRAAKAKPVTGDPRGSNWTEHEEGP